MNCRLTAIYFKERKGYTGFCLQIPAANGQGNTLSACKKSLSSAIALMLEENAVELMAFVPATYTTEPIVIDENKISEAISYGKRMQKVTGRQRAHNLVQPANKGTRSRAKAQ